MNEAVRRLTGYLFDQPEAGRGMAYANALRNSGAAGMLLPYRIHGLGYADAVEAAQAAVGSVGNPVIGLAINDGKLVVTFADGSTAELDLPAGMVVGDGTDQTARATATAALEAARTAQEAADANALAQAGHDGNANAHHVPPMGGGGVVSESTRLPLGTVVMRLGWAQTQTPAEAIFTRADLHPTDGAAEGTVAGLSVPPFPPGLDTDPSLYLFIWIATAAANIADIRLSGGGGTLVGSISNGAAYAYGGVDGTVYVSDQRLSAALAAYQVRAVVAGDLIASQPWVAEQIAAIPAGKQKWYWVGDITAPFVAGVNKNAVFNSGADNPYADYAELRAAIADGSITQVAVKVSQNDPGDVDGDSTLAVFPNIAAFAAGGLFDIFPAWTLGADPVRIRVEFTFAALVGKVDIAIPEAPFTSIRVGVFK